MYDTVKYVKSHLAAVGGGSGGLHCSHAPEEECDYDNADDKIINPVLGTLVIGLFYSAVHRLPPFLIQDAF